MTLTHGGLFEGTGGTTMAAELVLGPLDTRWVSDVKPAAVRLLEQRWPEVPNIGDMRWTHYARLQDVDVLTLSWPCQPHSSAGKRLGAADPRALWPYCEHAIRHLRPAVVLGENVQRIVTNGELDRVVAGLERLGYRVAWMVQRADALGVCHRRARLFLAAVDPLQERALERVADHLQLTEAEAGPGVGGRLLPTPGARDGKGIMPRGPRNDGHARSAAQLCLPGAVALLPTPTAQSYGTNVGGAAGRVGTVRESLDTMARLGRFDPAPERFGDYADAIARHEALIGRVAPEPTMEGRNGARQLSPWFVEWMMCLPFGHVCGLPDLGEPRPISWRSRALSLLGDGVVPIQGAAAFGPLLRQLLSLA